MRHLAADEATLLSELSAESDAVGDALALDLLEDCAGYLEDGAERLKHIEQLCERIAGLFQRFCDILAATEPPKP